MAVVGPNGSGKTTLIRALVGAVPPSSGTIVKDANLRIGYVPQRLTIDPTLPMTVGRFLNLPTRRSKSEVQDALENAGVGGISKRQMTALSGGQFQRVLLARAVLEKPHLLILDEPTTGLDQPGSADFYRQIEEVRSNLNCAVSDGQPTNCML